jgi:HK97 family phage prohead protease
MSKHWQDDGAGLVGTFGVRPGDAGDELLEDARDGYLPALSVGFLTLRQARGIDGVMEVREGKLMEVSILLLGAYEGSRVLAVRSAQDVADLLKPFSNPPQIDLTPVTRWW